MSSATHQKLPESASSFSSVELLSIRVQSVN